MKNPARFFLSLILAVIASTATAPANDSIVVIRGNTYVLLGLPLHLGESKKLKLPGGAAKGISVSKPEVLSVGYTKADNLLSLIGTTEGQSIIIVTNEKDELFIVVCEVCKDQAAFDLSRTRFGQMHDNFATAPAPVTSPALNTTSPPQK